MPKFAEVLNANGVTVVSRQELPGGEWLLLIAPVGAVGFPSDLYPYIILLAETRDPVDISDEEAAAVRRRFNPPLLPEVTDSHD